METVQGCFPKSRGSNHPRNSEAARPDNRESEPDVKVMEQKRTKHGGMTAEEMWQRWPKRDWIPPTPGNDDDTYFQPPKADDAKKGRLVEIMERITKKGDPIIPNIEGMTQKIEVKKEKGKGRQKPKQEECRGSKDIEQGCGVRPVEGKRAFRSPEGPPPKIRLLPREGITERDEVTTQRERRRETLGFVNNYGGEHELIAGVNLVICSRCGYRDHFSKLPEECTSGKEPKKLKKKKDKKKPSSSRSSACSSAPSSKKKKKRKQQRIKDHKGNKSDEKEPKKKKDKKESHGQSPGSEGKDKDKKVNRKKKNEKKDKKAKESLASPTSSSSTSSSHKEKQKQKRRGETRKPRRTRRSRVGSRPAPKEKTRTRR